MIRRPPRSTLFPYRRSSDLNAPRGGGGEWACRELSGWDSFCTALSAERSEEHTSELQSRLQLVCRLLLEKKRSSSASLALRRSPPRRACCSAHAASCLLRAT